MLNPNRRINSSLAMSAAVAGIIAGVSLSAGCNSKKVAEKPSVDLPNAERHGCNGQHKVEAKTETNDQKTKEHNGCNSANGCKAS